MYRFSQLLTRAAAKTLAFRAEIWLWMILESVPLLLFLNFWRSAYGAQTSIRGMNLDTLVYYFIVVLLINTLTASYFESWRIQEIREGKIDFYLVKPLGYITELFTRFLGDKLVSSVLKIPILLVFFLLVQLLFNPALPDLSLVHIVHATYFLCTAFIIQFCFSAIGTLIGFWLEYANGLDNFRWLVVNIFSGSVIPFAFMPENLLRFAELLPFKYLHSVPALILLGRQNITFVDILYALSTSIILLACVQLLWIQARKRYSAYGG